jgi:hypothetical protein
MCSTEVVRNAARPALASGRDGPWTSVGKRRPSGSIVSSASKVTSSTKRWSGRVTTRRPAGYGLRESRHPRWTRSGRYWGFPQRVVIRTKDLGPSFGADSASSGRGFPGLLRESSTAVSAATRPLAVVGGVNASRPADTGRVPTGRDVIASAQTAMTRLIVRTLATCAPVGTTPKRPRPRGQH